MLAMADYILVVRILTFFTNFFLLASDLRSVQSSRWDGPIFLMIPGTSCLATIVLSLRDKSHSPIEAPHSYLSAYGVNPGLNPGLRTLGFSVKNRQQLAGSACSHKIVHLLLRDRKFIEALCIDHYYRE
jgi:hypothetical protein